MTFKVGQKVVFLHEQGGGVVVGHDGQHRYIVEDEIGFSRTYNASDIGLVHAEDYQISDEDFLFSQGESSVTKVNHVIRKGVAQQRDYWEIDLHIEAITESHAGLSNSEIINKQMNAFKLFLNKARRKGMRKIVVIHGVGMGVLKHEVRTYLDRLDDLKYYDADYGEYGKGATCVEMWE